MCCFNEPRLAKKLYRRMEKGKTTFYKVYNFTVNRDTKKVTLKSYYRQTKIYSSGIIKGNSTVKNISSERKIYKGIHVFLESPQYYSYEGNLIIKVKAKANDLIGCGWEDAVFTKIEITKKDWKKAEKLARSRAIKNNYWWGK